MSLAILSSTIVLLLLKNSGHKVHWPVLEGDSFSLYETTHYLTPLILPLPYAAILCRLPARLEHWM